MNAAVADMVFEMDDRQAREIVEAKGRVWGWQWRRNFGEDVSIPVKSLMGRIQGDRFAVLEGSNERHYPEVFLGDGLEFASAMKHVAANYQEFAKVHFIVRQPAKVKASAMGVSIQGYWKRRNAMLRALAEVMDV